VAIDMWITLLAMAVAVSLEPFRIGMTVLMINRPPAPGDSCSPSSPADSRWASRWA
jgi:hypothetical protein